MNAPIKMAPRAGSDCHPAMHSFNEHFAHDTHMGWTPAGYWKGGWDARDKALSAGPGPVVGDKSGLRVVGFIECFDKKLEAAGFTDAQRYKVAALLADSHDIASAAAAPARHPAMIGTGDGQSYDVAPLLGEQEAVAVGDDEPKTLEECAMDRTPDASAACDAADWQCSVQRRVARQGNGNGEA